MLHVMRFMLSSCVQHHADIKDSNELTAADWARVKGYHSLVDCVERFQPGPRGELVIPLYMQVIASMYFAMSVQLESDQWFPVHVPLILFSIQAPSFDFPAAFFI